jgi:hypothetical protein
MKEDDGIEDRITNLRDSISTIGVKISSNNTIPSNTSNEDGELRKRMENELREAKEYLANEIDMLRNEMAKEREKYYLILKNKESEISNLIDEKVVLKENEAKKYEKIINRNELTLKLRESEIENLKIKLKKYELSKK